MNRFRKLAFAVIPLALATFSWSQSAAPAHKVAPVTAAASAPLVDINSASMGELKSVPGIGDAYANKIMGGRPYKTKVQLKSRNILPDAVYEKVKDKIVAKQK